MTEGLGAAVIGAGTMGVGIVHALAVAGATTYVVEPDGDRAATVVPTVRGVLEEGVARGRVKPDEVDRVLGRLRVLGDIDALPLGLDLVVESVPEIPDLKKALLARAEVREPRLLASNTSSLSIDELAGSLRRPERFCGMHFFNPVWSLRLVEIVQGAASAEETIEEATRWATWMGKEFAVVKDSPGFATSRLDLCLALEAIRMVEDEVATPEHIDRAVRIAYRHPVGPLELSDIVGLDVRLDIARSLAGSLGERYEPPQLLIDKVEAGELGRKSGLGFYAWSEGSGPSPRPSHSQGES